jgi:hypothetical protein
MATAKFAPCPHCQSALSYLCGVSGTRMNPPCPRCGVVVVVTRPTLLMADNSAPAPSSATVRRV